MEKLIPEGNYDVTCINIKVRQSNKKLKIDPPSVLLNAIFIINYGEYNGEMLSTTFAIKHRHVLSEETGRNHIIDIADALGLDTMTIKNMKDIKLKVSMIHRPSTSKNDDGIFYKIKSFSAPQDSPFSL